MIYLITGRTGSGKTKLAHELTKKGLIGVKSYTTRPKRNPRENTYNFITDEQAEAYDNKVAYTEVNGYKYFSLIDDIEHSDFYVINPQGVMDLAKAMPDTDFHIVFVRADIDARKSHAVSRYKNNGENIYNSRNSEESNSFDEFEKMLNRFCNHDTSENWPDNICAVHFVDNDYEPETIKEKAKSLTDHMTTHNRLVKIVRRCKELGVLNCNAENKIEVVYKELDADGNNMIYYTTDDVFADTLLSDHIGFEYVLSSWLLADSKIDKLLI